MTRRVADQGCRHWPSPTTEACTGSSRSDAAAKKAGIKPIIGVEAYVAPRGMTDKEGKQDADYDHMILLAKHDAGLPVTPAEAVDLTATPPRDRTSVLS